ncbi:MAG: non-canonical purine NTP pyrophosphatase [Candidatus Diapherotrites archaeon CG08_land_8_20_14_0_20_34_12]|nr:MAG: non-canonical purine NTP pyrophosphatase [Candidatus Diapherotrites archaeon CG08_land_8_20_14_0_20_34_12]
MKIILASSNKHKFEEMSKILKPYRIELERADVQVNESDFETLEESAEDKARKAFQMLKKPLIVEDTGVYFDAFKNFPGIYPKRMYLSLGFKGLLKLLEGEKRSAYFKTCVSYYDGFRMKTFSGKLQGKMAEHVHDADKDVLPYEKIFMPKGHKATLSAISREEKNTFSHRGIATRKFAEWASKRLIKH